MAQPGGQMLIRPAQIDSLPLLDANKKNNYKMGLAKLWQQMESNPQGSPAHQEAENKIRQASMKIMQEISGRNRPGSGGGANQMGDQQQRPPTAGGQQGSAAQGTPQSGNGTPTTGQPQANQMRLSPAVQQQINAITVHIPPNVSPQNAQQYKATWQRQLAIELMKKEAAIPKGRAAQQAIQQAQQQGLEVPQQVQQEYNNARKAVTEADAKVNMLKKTNEANAAQAAAQKAGGQQANGQQANMNAGASAVNNNTPEVKQEPSATPAQAPANFPQQAQNQGAPQNNQNATQAPRPPQQNPQGQTQMQQPQNMPQNPQQQGTGMPGMTQQQAAEAARLNWQRKQQQQQQAQQQGNQGAQQNTGQQPQQVQQPRPSLPQSYSQQAALQAAQSQAMNPTNQPQQQQQPPMQQPHVQNGMPFNPQQPQSATQQHGPPTAYPQNNMHTAQQAPTNKFPIAKTLQLDPRTQQPVPGPAARPTLSNQGMIGQPGLTRPQPFTLEGEGDHVLSKRKLDELVRQVTGSADTSPDAGGLAPEVEEAILALADDFFDELVTSACRLAKLRSSQTLEPRDIQMVLERNYGLRIPGFSLDEARTAAKKFQPAAGWQSKMQAVQTAKTLGGVGKTDS